VALGAALCLLAGCAHNRLDQALLADRNPTAHARDITASYPIHCPDVVALRIQGHPEWSRPCPVGPDGRIAPGGCEPLRIDGLSAAQVAGAVAHSLGVPAARVRVRVDAYNSRQLYLVGELPGLPRAVPYRGPETVLDLLQRIGGITPNGAPDDIRVVRTHVADGRPPEVFHVNLQAILLEHDQQTNILLEPFDQVHLGERRSSRLECCVPPWLRPFYCRACGVQREPPGGVQ
jgi:protein involved in polysaccharide export with SLBB domain